MGVLTGRKGKVIIVTSAFKWYVMKKLLLILAIVSIAACSKMDPNPIHLGKGNEVSWRFVVYDSSNRVVDSTPELHFPDSALVTMLGSNVVTTIPSLAPHDTVDWLKAASFFMVVGPSTLLPGDANIPVPSGGCAFNVNYLFPSLDRTGWMLQRTENGIRINMFSQVQENNGYNGKYNDFPYLLYINGLLYPNVAEQDYSNQSWICGSTQGSCQGAPPFAN